MDHRLSLNTGDSNPYRGKRCYLLGTGSCLEFGEEGFVGRGNTPAGYIPLHRPKSAEAAFGKNPVYHAGKVYAIHAAQIARRIFEATGAPATVTIASRHSDPLRQPSLTDVAAARRRCPAGRAGDRRDIPGHRRSPVARPRRLARAPVEGQVITGHATNIDSGISNKLSNGNGGRARRFQLSTGEHSSYFGRDQLQLSLARAEIHATGDQFPAVRAVGRICAGHDGRCPGEKAWTTLDQRYSDPGAVAAHGTKRAGHSQRSNCPRSPRSAQRPA